MHQTVAGALKGKLLYMSPEQARGEDNIDFRSDLYSAGIILFELITGEKLFIGNTDLGILQKVQDGKFIKPSLVKKDIPQDLETIILKALEKDRYHRYQKASDMIKDLDNYIMKNYDSFPEASHIAHFIYTLFKEEIIKDNIDIPFKPIPHPIKKIKRDLKDSREMKTPPKKETSPIPTIPPIPTPPKIEIENETPPVKEIPDFPELTDHAKFKEEPFPSQPTPSHLFTPPPALDEEDFQPIIEINFDEDKKEEKTKTEKKKKIEKFEKTKEKKFEKDIKEPMPSTPFLSTFETASISENKEHKKKLVRILILIALIIILAVVIGIYFIGTGSSSPQKEKPAVPTDSPKSETTQPGTTPTATPAAGEVTPSTLPDNTQTSTTPPTLTQAEKDKLSPKDPKNDAAKEKEKEKEKETAATQKQEKIKPDEKEKKPETTPPSTAADTTTTEKEKQPEPAKTEPTPTTTEKEKPAQEEEKPTEESRTIKEGDILSPSDVDTNAEPTSTQEISINRSVQQLLIADQRILASFLIDHNGSVESVQLVQKSNIKNLNDSVISSIKKWKFKPAVKNGIRVKVWKNKWIIIKK